MRDVTGVHNVTEIRPGAAKCEPPISAGDTIVPAPIAAILSGYQDELFEALGSLRVLDQLLDEIDDGTNYDDMRQSVRGIARVVQRISVALTEL